jgi:hypothetical protein
VLARRHDDVSSIASFVDRIVDMHDWHERVADEIFYLRERADDWSRPRGARSSRAENVIVEFEFR